jgi:hypothetical protein
MFGGVSRIQVGGAAHDVTALRRKRSSLSLRRVSQSFRSSRSPETSHGRSCRKQDAETARSKAEGNRTRGELMTLQEFTILFVRVTS